MAALGILSSGLLQYGAVKSMQQSRQAMQQLGQDLQSGNLASAQTDFASFQQLLPQAGSSSSSTSSSTSQTSSNTISQEFNQLGQDLQSGNLSAAQKDYAAIQQSEQNQNQTQTHHHHHHHGGGGGDINQLMAQLGQDLQSGNLSNAQQAYGSLQQDLQQFGIMTSSTDSSSSSNSISVSA
jgi:hypothetical protein